MTTPEYAIQPLIPLWSTNPALPPGQPYPDEPDRIDPNRFRTRAAAEAACNGWEPGTWRIMVRHVTPWGIA
jgi:hypothetical protein